MNPFSFTTENTFCINLDSATERWERMQSRLLRENILATRWSASTANTITDNFSHNLTSSQKGCAQSHINIWRHIVENKLEYALVLEDDACFDQRWQEKLQIFSDTITDDYLHAIFLNASEPIAQQDSWVQCFEQYLTGGYIITYEGARALLNDFGGHFFSADWMTSRLQYHNHCYSYFPWLIIQEGLDSSIGSNLDADHAKVLRCLGEINYSVTNYRI